MLKVYHWYRMLYTVRYGTVYHSEVPTREDKETM